MDYFQGPLNAVRQAWFGEYADRLIGIPYDSLARRPAEVMNCLYTLLGELPFDHSFDDIDYDEPEIDALLGAPGFHKVAPRVEAIDRPTILPPEIFATYDRCFWTAHDGQRRVTVL